MGRIVGATIDRDCRGTSPIESMATSVLDMGRIVGATIDRDCRGTSPIESMATAVLATRVPVLNRRLTRPLFRLIIFFLATAPIMGAWEVEYFHAVDRPLLAVDRPLLGHRTSRGLHNDGSRYTGLSNDSVCESLAPVILSDDDPSRGIGRLVTAWAYTLQ